MFISLDCLGKDFPKKPCALDGLTLDLPSGMIGLIGPNGAGKTTLMRILCGIVGPTRGRVLVDGHDLSEPRNRRALKKALGYLPQDIEPYPNLTPPLMAPPAGAVVVNAATTAQGTRYRIVSDAPPAGSAPVEPTLEDGYMALAAR